MAYRRSPLEIVASRRLYLAGVCKQHRYVWYSCCEDSRSGKESQGRPTRRAAAEPPVVCIPHQGHHLPQIHVYMNSMTLADNKYAANATRSQCCTGFQEDSLLPALGLLLPNPATQSADDGRSTSHFPD